jgi:hypothetical protein
MSDDASPLFLRLPLPHDDEIVNKIMQRVIPAFAEADFEQALSVVVHLFAMAICNCSPSEREAIVRGTADSILAIATTMARLPGGATQ